MKKLYLLFLCLLIFPASVFGIATQTGKTLIKNATANTNGDTIASAGYTVATFSVSGTFSATITPQATVNGVDYFGLTCFQLDGTTPVTAFVIAGSWRCNIVGHTIVRAPVSGYNSGTVTVDVNLSDVGTPITKQGGGGGGGGGSVSSVDATLGVETLTQTPISSTGTIRGAGYVNDQSGTSYTLDVSDRGKLVSFSNSSPIAVALIGNIAGWYTDVENRGVNTLTLTPSVGLIDGAASLAVGPSSGVRIFSNGTNYFTMRGGGTGGAPVDAGFITDRANGVLTNEISLGLLSTGALIGTVSGGISTISAFAGITCTNQVLRILPAALTGSTCATVTSAFVDSSIAVTGSSNTWAAGVKQTFSPNNTNAGINFGSNASQPSSPVNGDCLYNSTATEIECYENTVWHHLGIQAEVDTRQTVFARGKTITGANSFANARRDEDGSGVGKATYTDATYGVQDNCYNTPGAGENDCNYTRWLLTGKTFKFLANDRTTSIGTLTSAASSGSWTDISLNAEGTNNNLTTVSKINWATVACFGTSGLLLLDTNATLAPTATCTAGSTNTTLIQGYADFPDLDGDYSLQVQAFRLPADWSGAMDLQLFWKSAATTNNVVWQVATMCTADGAIEDVAWNTADKFAADTAKGTTLQINDATKTGITTTGCSAGNLMHLKVFRNRTDASDTITGVVSLKNIEGTFRRTQ